VTTSPDPASKFRETYSRMSDDELLRLAAQRDTLLDIGRQELEAEMRQRGLDDRTVASFESNERKEAEYEKRQTDSRKSEAAEARLRVGQRLIIFVLTAVAMDQIIARLFSLNSKAVEGLAEASISVAIGLSVLGWIFPKRWSPWKTTLVMAFGLATAIYLFMLVILMTASHS